MRLDIFQELVDRFGSYPPVVADLFGIALVRIKARRRKVERIEVRGGRITVTGAEKTETLPGGMAELLQWLDRA